jgi:Condensation domain/Phosphopantetheine attachment site
MELDERIAGLSPAKRELLAQWLADEPADRAASAAYAPASTDIERALVGIWQEELEAERVGIDDDYFELGGDSIHAIVIVGRAQQAGIALEAPDLFEYRTIRAVAQRAVTAALPASGALAPEAAGDGAAPESGPPRPAGYPLTPLQEGMLYHAVGGSTPGAYLVQLRCRLDGPLDPQAYRCAWQAVFEANPALRTVVRWTHGERPYQIFTAGPQLPFDVVDHAALSRDQREAAFTRLLEDDRARGFDLEAGPLMRLILVREGADEHRCVWTYQHVILDGWAQQLVLRDVLDCYLRLRAGLMPAPRARPSFVSYLSWLAGQPRLDGGSWRDRLAGLAGPTRVAGPGCADGQVITAARPMAELAVPDALAAALPAFGRERGMTVSTLVHGAWALLLASHSGQDDVVFGTTLSGRPPDLPGATECVGMFASTLPLRVRCPREIRALDWLEGLQRDLAGLAGQQHVALSQVERLAGLGHGVPLFDSIVVVENFPTWIRGGDQVADLRIGQLAVIIEEGYPLVLEFAPGPAPVLRARYDEGRLGRDVVTGALRALASCLRCMVDEPQVLVGELRDSVTADWRRHTAQIRRERSVAAGQRLAAARCRPVPGTGQGAAP